MEAPGFVEQTLFNNKLCYRNIMDLNELVKCPLVDEHQVSRRRLQYHIVKCLKTYNGRKVQCPYNALEFCYPEEFESHLKFCKSKDGALNQYFSLDLGRMAEAKRRVVPAPVHHPEQPLPEDQWGL